MRAAPCAASLALLLWAALAALARGWSVIPVRPRDKRPIVAWQAYQEERPTVEQLERWWTRWPEANVGIVTGAISGLVVLDWLRGVSQLTVSEGLFYPTGQMPFSGNYPVFFTDFTCSLGREVPPAPGERQQ